MGAIEIARDSLPATELLNEVERRLVDFGGEIHEHGEVPSCPVVHTFVDGLYVREIFNPAGAIIVTRTHKGDHPFFVKQGVCAVYSDGDWDLIRAPYSGITKAGTRRMIVAVEDVLWITVHPNPGNVRDIDLLEEMLVEEHENPLLISEVLA